MQIILQKTVSNLGLVGDVVQVAPGYYRNYLAPRKLAFIANPKSIRQMEHQKKIIEIKKTKEKTIALSLKEKIEANSVKLVHSAGAADRLFGSVTSQEIVQKLKEAGFEVEKKYIQISVPIKSIGEHKVFIRLHPEVTAEITVEVAKKEEKEKDQPMEALPKKAGRKKTAKAEVEKEVGQKTAASAEESPEPKETGKKEAKKAVPKKKNAENKTKAKDR